MQSSAPVTDPDLAKRPAGGDRSVVSALAVQAKPTSAPAFETEDDCPTSHRAGPDHGGVTGCRSASDEDTVDWTVHLAKAEPAKLAGVAGAVIAAFALGWMAFDSWVGGVLGASLVFSAVAEFVLPIRYRLTDEGAHCAYGLARLSIPWSSVRRVIVGPDSLRLSPFARPSRLDAFRGVQMRWDSVVMPEERLREAVARRVPATAWRQDIREAGHAG